MANYIYGQTGGAPNLLPSAVGSRTGTYDKAGSLYTPSNWSAAPLRAALAKARNTGTLVNVACLGDSKMYGYPVGQFSAWPSVIRSLMANLGFPSAGTGICLACSAGVLETSRWANSGAWSAQLNYMQVNQSGATLTFTSDVAGTVVEVWFYDSTAGFTVTIDGGAPQTVTPGGTSTINKATYTGLANTTHTVVITTTSASTVYIIGAGVRGTSGLLFHNFGLYGAQSNAFTSLAFTQMLPLAQYFNPDAIILSIGSNDAGAGTAVSTYAANIATALAAFSTSAKLLMVESQRAVPAWPTFQSANYDLGDTIGAQVIDITDRWISAANGIALGLLNADALHETAQGQFDVARTIANALAA